MNKPSCRCLSFFINSGLHDDDVDKLCYIIRELTSKGATVIVIEHNPRIISQADYIIEMGPEGGENGGYILKDGWLKITQKEACLGITYGVS